MWPTQQLFLWPVRTFSIVKNVAKTSSRISNCCSRISCTISISKWKIFAAHAKFVLIIWPFELWVVQAWNKFKRHLKRYLFWLMQILLLTPSPSHKNYSKVRFLSPPYKNYGCAPGWVHFIMNFANAYYCFCSSVFILIPLSSWSASASLSLVDSLKAFEVISSILSAF